MTVRYERKEWRVVLSHSNGDVEYFGPYDEVCARELLLRFGAEARIESRQIVEGQWLSEGSEEAR